jgi:hypothetical protein
VSKNEEFHKETGAYPAAELTSMLKPSVALVVAVSHMRNRFTQRSVRERYVRSTNICRWIKFANRNTLSSALQLKSRWSQLCTQASWGGVM